jgi:SAM-dependent methyltransferase
MGLISGMAGKRLLHVAPESCLSRKLQRIYEYISVDLDGSRALMQMDITGLTFPNEYFDAIVCNHVLEHIPDDHAALSEMYRVLKPGGWASIQVPLAGETTVEDLSVSDPLKREQRFGQHDHVRSYGKDFMQRLQSAGFSVTVLPKEMLVDREMLLRIAVECEDQVWISTKGCSPGQKSREEESVQVAR